MPETILPSIKTLPLGLPLPAWYTQTHAASLLINDARTDEALLEIKSYHYNWHRFFYGDYRNGPAYRAEWREYQRALEAFEAVEGLILRAICHRFENIVRGRKTAAFRATATRQRNKHCRAQKGMAA